MAAVYWVRKTLQIETKKLAKLFKYKGHFLSPSA